MDQSQIVEIYLFVHSTKLQITFLFVASKPRKPPARGVARCATAPLDPPATSGAAPAGRGVGGSQPASRRDARPFKILC